MLWFNTGAPALLVALAASLPSCSRGGGCLARLLAMAVRDSLSATAASTVSRSSGEQAADTGTQADIVRRPRTSWLGGERGEGAPGPGAPTSALGHQLAPAWALTVWCLALAAAKAIQRQTGRPACLECSANCPCQRPTRVYFSNDEFSTFNIPHNLDRLRSSPIINNGFYFA